MKLTWEDVCRVTASEVWTGMISRAAFQRMADALNDTVEQKESQIPTKDMLEAEGQLRLF